MPSKICVGMLDESAFACHFQPSAIHPKHITHEISRHRHAERRNQPQTTTVVDLPQRLEQSNKHLETESRILPFRDAVRHLHSREFVVSDVQFNFVSVAKTDHVANLNFHVHGFAA